MKLKTFRGGVHPLYAKELTSHKSIREMKAPSILVVPLQQHIGAPTKAVVKPGDEVLMGQVIGETDQPVSAKVHSPVSGKVIAIEPRPHISGRSVLSVVIENDEQDRWVKLDTHFDPIQLSREEILAKIFEAGIVGMGGAAFPTSVKLKPPGQAKIDFLIINGSECEPYLTADHRMMIESPDDVILGAKLLAKAVGASKIIIGVEDNKLDAIKVLEEKKGSDAISIVALDTKYPQGGEKQLIKALTGREVPSNGLPFQVGVIVHNIGTAIATVEATRDGRPLIGRVVTVTGSGVSEPDNLYVRIGTPIKDVIEACGGFNGEPGKVIIGGPMMGLAQFDLDAPIMKATGGVLVFTQDETVQYDPMPCIKCSRCVDVCPAYLLPLRLEKYGMYDLWDEAADYGAMDCIECGCCTYICPSKRHLLHWIRLAKNEIVSAQRRQNS